MSESKHVCPGCGQRISVPDEFLGEPVDCPSCGKAFTPAAEEAPAPKKTPAAAARRSAPANRISVNATAARRSAPRAHPQSSPSNTLVVVLLLWSVAATGAFFVKLVTSKSHVTTLQGALVRQRRVSEQRTEQIKRLNTLLDNRAPVASGTGNSSTPTKVIGTATKPITPTRIVGTAVTPIRPTAANGNTNEESGGDPVEFTSKKLQHARTTYETAITKAEANYRQKCDDLSTSYSTALLEMRKRLGEQGDLDGVLAVRDEIATIENDGLPDSADSASLAIKKMQVSVMKTAEGYELEMETRLASFRKQYQSRLNMLEKQHTKSGELAKAIEVRTEKERISN